MRWSGGRDVRPEAEGLQPGVSHYYIGNDPMHWHADVPHFAGLHYRNIYDGIDLTFGRKGRRLEYQFTIAPGGEPS